MKNLIYTVLTLSAVCLFSISAKAQVQTYTVVNNTDMVISSVSISPDNQNKWGTGLNMTGNIPVGKSFEFTQSFDNSNCVHDIRFIGSDGMTGDYYYIQDVNLCSTTTISLVKTDNNTKGSDFKNSDDTDTDKDRKTDKDGLEDKIQHDKEQMEKDPIDKK
jgi:hypothetical protein